MKIWKPLIGIFALGTAVGCATNNLSYEGRIFKNSYQSIVANDLKQEGAGFATDTNIAKLIFSNGKIEELPIMTKKELSKRIYDKIIYIIQSKK